MLLASAACNDVRNVSQPEFTSVTAGTLAIATTLPAPGFWDGETATSLTGGFEWAIARALADRFHLELKVVDVPFDRIVSGDFGGADMAISQISVTDKRGKSVDFSVPYYTTGAGVLGRDGDKLTDLKTARKRRWAVLGGTTHAAFIADVIRPDADVLVFDDNVAVAQAVADGTVDDGLFDLTTALVLQHQVDGVATVASFATDERYAIALPNGSDNLALVDAAVQALDADGSLKSFADKWLDPVLGADPNAIPVIITEN